VADGLNVSIVGAGQVGAASAAAVRRFANVRLFDVLPGLAEGKAMDINHASVLAEAARPVRACERLDELAGSDVVIVTAGAPRWAGMQRKDLLQQNLQPALDIGRHVMDVCPRAQVLVVTNPAEALVWFLAQRWPRMRVCGFGCTLDTIRFRYYLAAAAGASPAAVRGMVIGSHDDRMVPLVRLATIEGQPAREVLSAEQIADVVRSTRQAGAQIVARLKTRGSYYAAAQCVADIVASIVEDRQAVFPLGARGGAYGLEDTCLALPRPVGAAGVGPAVPLELDPPEREALGACARHLAETIGPFRSLL